MSPESAGFGVFVTPHFCQSARGHRATGTMHGVCVSLVNTGVAQLEVEGQPFVVDPATLLLSTGRRNYSVHHRHCQGGRSCATSLILEGQAWKYWEELTLDTLEPHGRPRALRAGPTTWIAFLRVVDLYRKPTTQLLDFEEAVAELVAAGLDLWRPGSRGKTSAVRQRHRQIVQRAQEYLVGSYSEPLDLARVASHAGSSKYHLCRIFRDEMGMTLGRYVRRLRTHEAIRRFDEGQRDLATLASDLGYCSHSHFTAAIVSETGCIPSRLRDELLSPGAARSDEAGASTS